MLAHRALNKYQINKFCGRAQVGIWEGECACHREPGRNFHASTLREGRTPETQGGRSVR